MVRAATRRSRCCNGCHSHSRNSCSDGRGGEAVTRVQVRVVLGASPAVEGLGRCPHTAAVAVEGCIRGVGVGGETVSADEWMLTGSNHTLPAL